MEQVLNLLSDIEEKANSIIDHTSVEKKALYSANMKKIEAMEQEISSHSKKELDIIRKKMNQEIETEQKDIFSVFEANMNKLANAVKDHHDALVEAVFQKIIGE